MAIRDSLIDFEAIDSVDGAFINIGCQIKRPRVVLSTKNVFNEFKNNINNN